jgi:hypothetical protein
VRRIGRRGRRRRRRTKERKKGSKSCFGGEERWQEARRLGLPSWI